MKFLNRNQKGQGALEYLLLIGGAVLIAVIVIALLVGMGGQSRETAQDQASKAQKALEQPQPSNIVSINPITCDDSTNLDADVNITWQKLGEGGTNKLVLYDYEGTELDITNLSADDELTSEGKVLVEVNDSTATSNKCSDTYWAEIQTTKNGQTVKSTQMKFNW